MKSKSKKMNHGGKSFQPISNQELVKVLHPEHNTHPWVSPVETLFGSPEGYGDMVEYFADVTKKKSLSQRAVTLIEVINLLHASIDVEKMTIDNVSWKYLLGSPDAVEASAFTDKQLVALAKDVRTHYGMVSVATGFDWAARGINARPLMEALEWWELMPLQWAEYWDVTVLIVIWFVYEAMGLGGLNRNAMVFHQLMRRYCRSGTLNEKMIPEQLLDVYLDAGSDPQEFMFQLWKNLLKDEGILPKWINEPVIFELVVFLGTLREITQRMEAGLELTKHLKAVSFGDLGPAECKFLASATRLLRDGAKGRLNMEGDEDNPMIGSLRYLCSADCEEVLELLQDLPGNETPVAVVALLDLISLLQSWVTGRQEAIAQDNII